MMSFASTVEPLRAANRISGRDLYAWDILSVDGQPVEASNGIPIVPSAAPDPGQRAPDTVCVVCGLDPQLAVEPSAVAWLRRMASRGSRLMGVATGSYLLARSGLLDGYRCTIHWENMAAFVEQFPDLDVTRQLFEVDRTRLTCSGGTAALDMMLYLIGMEHGHALRTAVSEQFIHTNMRQGGTPQRMDLRQRIGVSHPKLLEAIAVIEQNLQEPLSQADLARSVGLSTRQLERLFRMYLNVTPSRYYLDARLKHAQQLLAQTSISVLDVAIACGFASASHFAKCYRALFGHPPRAERSPARSRTG